MVRVRHIVLVKFPDTLGETEIADIWRQLRAIEGKVDGLLNIHAGKSKSPEMMERGYLHGFTADFASWEALAAYQEHPEHKQLGARLVANAVGGLEGILVFDLPILST